MHGLATWNGWRYWMAMTPFPSSDNDYENPSIIVSNNGLNWQEPAGITNPIAPWPGGSGYNSDTDLVYDPVEDRLICYYRDYKPESTPQQRILARTSSDGATWSAEVELLGFQGINWWLSPGVVFDGDVWRMWVVQRYGSPNSIEMFTSTDPLAWGTPADCTLSGLPPTREPWHLNVFAHQGVLYMILNVTDLDIDASATTLHLAASSNGSDWTVSAEVIGSSASGWDRGNVYRATGYVEGDTIRVWYSAIGGTTWGLGYTEIPLAEAPVPG